jgi:two-component system sensor histidine kinase/response regulator
MDIQMPEMDGLEATRLVRTLDREGVDGLPILAVTAHAISGDRENSLAAGMNDHLTKPIDPDALSAALRRWLPPETRAAGAAEESGQNAPEGALFDLPTPGLDMEDGLRRVAGNRELYRKLLADFASKYGDTPEQLLDELRTDRLADATHRVHTVRGIAGNLGAANLSAAAQELEEALRAPERLGSFSLGVPVRTFIDRHYALMVTIGTVLSRRPATEPARTDAAPGTVEELRPLLIRLRAALANDELKPCKEVLATLLHRHWPGVSDAALAEVDRLARGYRFADALTTLDRAVTHLLDTPRD